MTSEIILIGPPTAGKTTLGMLVATMLPADYFCLDDIRWRYMREIGYDADLDREYRQKGGFLARTLYWQLFGPYVVERFLEEHRSGVLDFGSGHTIYDSEESSDRVRRVLAPYANVFLVLPSPVLKKSIRVLNRRLASQPVELNFDFITHFVRHPANYKLAKHTVYTKGRTVEACRDQIIDLAQ